MQEPIKQFTKQVCTAYGSPRHSPDLVENINYQTIKDELSQSPTGIRPTDQRIEFLNKAKQIRFAKKQQIRLTNR
jgi:hypothetical protein